MKDVAVVLLARKDGPARDEGRRAPIVTDSLLSVGPKRLGRW